MNDKSVRFSPKRKNPNPVTPPELLILYDGVCGLCDRTVQFLLAKDKSAKFKFAPLQGETATRIYKRHHQQKPAQFESILFVKEYQTSHEIILQKSDAAIEIMAILGGFWKLFAILGKMIPRMIRDGLYDWIAKNRYHWFGKFDQCRLPLPETKDRFLN